MSPLLDKEVVELFHLHFVRLLQAGKDRLSLPIKGGCNLRFFFGSLRYSEDLDLDVRNLEQHVLKERVDSVLGGRALRDMLAASEIAIAEITTSKQTATTQRWKITLRVEGRTVTLHTKIEFSRRESEGDVALEAVNPVLSRHYSFPQVLAVHYLLPAAIRQKVGALVGRSEVQARDVFDLGVLCAKAGGDLSGYTDLLEKVPEAMARIELLTFGEYTGQVIAYLVPEQAEPYSTELAFTTLQLQVMDALQTIAAPA